MGRKLIYLDDAIDEIKMLLEQSEDDEHDKTWNNAIRGTINAIKHHVPSVQSETFEWCHDCKEYDQEQHCCHRWSQQIRKTIEELEANYPQEAKEELQYWKERAAKLERDYYINNEDFYCGCAERRTDE